MPFPFSIRERERERKEEVDRACTSSSRDDASYACASLSLSLFSSSPSLVVFQAEARRIDLRRRNARSKKHNRRKHTVSRNKKHRPRTSVLLLLSSSLLLLLLLLLLPQYQYFTCLDKISSLLAYFTHCTYFLTFSCKTPSKKNLVRRECVSLTAPSELPFTRRIGLLLNKRKT